MSCSDLEIDLLRAFVAVAETGSFTAAADVVGRSQSAVSQKVLRLEEILDRRVFDRTSRSLSLTRDGERLLVSARRMLEFNDAVMRELREPQAAGTLRLGISEDFIPGQLPSLLGPVDIKVDVGDSPARRNLIQSYPKEGRFGPDCFERCAMGPCGASAPW